MDNISEEFIKIEFDRNKQKKLNNKLSAIENEINNTEKTLEELKNKKQGYPCFFTLLKLLFQQVIMLITLYLQPLYI